jgi:hypothetical protein
MEAILERAHSRAKMYRERNYHAHPWDNPWNERSRLVFYTSVAYWTWSLDIETELTSSSGLASIALSAVSQEDFDPEVIMVAFEQRLGRSNEIRLVNWLRGNRNMVSQRTGIGPVLDTDTQSSVYGGSCRTRLLCRVPRLPRISRLPGSSGFPGREHYSIPSTRPIVSYIFGT